MSYKLKHPVAFGSETITEFVFKPTAGAFRNFSQKVDKDGSIHHSPFDLALVGVRAAGHPDPVADKLHPSDMQAIAEIVIGFYVPAPAIGNAGSGS